MPLRKGSTGGVKVVESAVQPPRRTTLRAGCEHGSCGHRGSWRQLLHLCWGQLPSATDRLDVLDVRELHLQVVGATAGFAEACLSHAFGGDALELLLDRAGFSTARPVLVVARFLASARCQRWRTASSGCCARSARGGHPPAELARAARTPHHRSGANPCVVPNGVESGRKHETPPDGFLVRGRRSRPIFARSAPAPSDRNARLLRQVRRHFSRSA